MTDADEQPWLREQLHEINVMLRALLTLAKLDSDIRLVAAPAATPAQMESADATEDEAAA